ncbi:MULTISPECIES: hypothetical protein [Streptomyces]|uniref:Uncharacterized protein n=1 Tax=Streptomyces koelreuteriae TaxID=2838015 RepID=A0ABX8FV41_9ACTN|nr:MULTISPECIES: hypothetical protein [Streptomyces]QWB25043.1 hypothetical protein KJK29_22095 [Streptomyces koelreuteriae]UUA08076.1 hypothetical protein NNW98_22235 [Streptomyces koelreuteriae]UUA15683.1 hypothetical protein NNW99_22120 [Streptomyces sp. CRCS-T-1]
MRHQHWMIWLATGLGAGMVAGGWLMDGLAYVPGFLLEIGVTLLLLVPIALLEQRLRQTERQTRELNEGLRRVDQQVRRTAEEVQRLGQASVDGGFSEREAALAAAAGRRDQPSIRRALEQAHETGAVSSDGVRVRPAGLDDARLRFRPARDPRDAVVVRVEAEVSGATVTSAWEPWRPGENARRLCRRLNALAVGLGAGGPGMQHLPFEELVTLLRLAVTSHTGDGRDLGAVIELANEEWVVSDDGLYGRPWPYRVPRALIVGDSAGEVAQYGVRNAPLADPARLADALAIARVAYRAGPGTGPPP